MGSGAVEIRPRIWLSAWVRALRAEDRATRKTRMDSTFPSLVLASPAGVAGEGGTGGRDGVLGIGLALAPATLAIGPVDFDDADPLGLEMAGEPGAIGPGPFDADQLDRAEVAQPAQQLLVAAPSVVAKLSTPRRAPRSSKAAATWTSRCVSTPPVMLRGKVVTVIPSLDWVGVTPHQRDDGQDSDGPVQAGSYEVTPSDRRVSSG